MVQPQHIEYWRNQRAKQQQQAEAMKQATWQEVQAIAKLLKQEFGATQVIV
jgi:hypothetical protein